MRSEGLECQLARRLSVPLLKSEYNVVIVRTIAIVNMCRRYKDSIFSINYSLSTAQKPVAFFA